MVAKEHGSMPMNRAHKLHFSEIQVAKIIIGGIVAYAIYCTPFQLIYCDLNQLYIYNLLLSVILTGILTGISTGLRASALNITKIDVIGRTLLLGN